MLSNAQSISMLPIVPCISSLAGSAAAPINPCYPSLSSLLFSSEQHSHHFLFDYNIDFWKRLGLLNIEWPTYRFFYCPFGLFLFFPHKSEKIMGIFPSMKPSQASLESISSQKLEGEGGAVGEGAFLFSRAPRGVCAASPLT